jgi:predicted esterase
MNKPYLLYKPAMTETSKRPEIWLALHGATGTAGQGLELFAPAAETQSALLVACQGSRPLGKGFAWSFKRDLSLIMDNVEQVKRESGGEQQLIGLCGFSMGCTMGLWLLANYPTQFRFFAAISIGSAFERWELDDGGLDESGLRRAAKVTPLFVAVDQQDPYGCTAYFDKNLTKLAELGFRVQPFAPNENQHAVTPLITKELVSWIGSL